MDHAGTISREYAAPKLQMHVDVQDRTHVLNRLTAEWKAAWSRLGLSNATTIVDLVKRLDIDRGTAQRLNKIAKWSDLEPANLGQFPGVRAWQRVLAGVESVLGPENLNFQRLSVACNDFGKWLGEMGGSRSAAMRKIDSTEVQKSPSPSKLMLGQRNLTAREAWVEAAIETFGYGVDVRLSLQMERENKTISPARMDLALLHILKGCRGNLGALPIAFSRAAYSHDRAEVEASEAGNSRSFRVLNSGTSKPLPVLVTTVDSQHQTIFIEPNWTSMAHPLDLAILHEEPQASLSPWGIDKVKESSEAAFVNRHPNRKLVIERMVSRYVDSRCTATLRAFRTQMILTQVEPWFDRIPENTKVQRVGTVEEARQQEPCPGYAAAISEAMGLLHWDWDDMIVYRAEIINPMPLATYTIKFESSHA